MNKYLVIVMNVKVVSMEGIVQIHAHQTCGQGEHSKMIVCNR